MNKVSWKSALFYEFSLETPFRPITACAQSTGSWTACSTGRRPIMILQPFFSQHLYIFGSLLKTLKIRSAGANLDVIIRDAVKYANRVVANICIIDVSRDARRIERNICSRIDATRIPQLMEPFQTCIQRRLSAA